MKLEFDIPVIFCCVHGDKMRFKFFSDSYNTKTGALDSRLVHYRCPRWFCENRANEYVVLGGHVVTPAKK